MIRSILFLLIGGGIVGRTEVTPNSEDYGKLENQEKAELTCVVS